MRTIVLRRLERLERRRPRERPGVRLLKGEVGLGAASDAELVDFIRMEQGLPYDPAAGFSDVGLKEIINGCFGMW